MVQLLARQHSLQPGARTSRVASLRANSRFKKRSLPCQASLDVPDGLVVLPVFTGASVLLPTAQGVLRAFEPRYRAMFQRLVASAPPSNIPGRGAKFLHILGHNAAPPAMLDHEASSATLGLPQIGCCAVIESVQNLPDGSLVVQYSGHRRLSVNLVQKTQLNNDDDDEDQQILTAAGEWFDDLDADELSGVSMLNAAERDVAAVVKEIGRLAKIVDPERSALPEALQRFAPPVAGQTRPTSYDALKAAGHKAATAIEMWRRSGSVYETKKPEQQQKYADPYTQFAETLGRQHRQEMFSFAAAQLLQMGTPEAAALLLSRDTAARLEFVLEAARPYLAQLSAEAAVKGALRGGKG